MYFRSLSTKFSTGDVSFNNNKDRLLHGATVSSGNSIRSRVARLNLVPDRPVATSVNADSENAFGDAIKNEKRLS